MTSARHGGDSHRRWRTAAAVAVLVAAGGLVYSNSFTDLFLGIDGKQSIRDNPHIHRLWPLSEAISLPLWEIPANQDQVATVVYRPFFSASLALTNRLIGTEPRHHHAVNLAIHIGAALFLFGLVRRSVGHYAGKAISPQHGDSIAAASALLWLVHPLQTESVTFLVQRSESQMGLLLLASVYAAVRAVDSRYGSTWKLLAVLACFAATGTKQTAAVVPLLVLLHDHTFAPATSHRYRPWLYAAMAAPLAVLAWAIAEDAQRNVGRADAVFSFILAQPGVILHYLRLTVWPNDLYLYVNTTLFDVSSTWQVVLPALPLVAAVLGTLWALAVRHWSGFVGAWFFLTLGPVASVIPIPDTIQEHRMYIPLAALSVLGVVAGDVGLRRWIGARIGNAGAAAVACVLLGVVACALGMRSHARNVDYHHEFGPLHPADWHTNYRILADHAVSRADILAREARMASATLASDDASVPEEVFARFILGTAAAQAGRWSEAEEHLRRVVQIDPGFAYGHHRLALILHERGARDEAIAHLESAVEIDPDDVFAHKDLALLLDAAGDSEAAANRLELAVEIDPDFAEGLYELGLLAARRGEDTRAEELLRRSIASQADLADAHYELGRLLAARDDLDAAAASFRSAIEHRPDLAKAHRDLGAVLATRGDGESALASLREALRLDPASARTHMLIGVVARVRNDLTAAKQHLELATVLRPDLARAHAELGEVALRENDLRAAAQHFRRAASLAPENVALRSKLKQLQAAESPTLAPSEPTPNPLEDQGLR